ncbi:MAG: hypothetical protein LH702_08745 [Phormidesmis sp. CAN_BIN44]|nr:hypothetical protein [Phormidesmis sp. CAN_BIN44]
MASVLLAGASLQAVNTLMHSAKSVMIKARYLMVNLKVNLKNPASAIQVDRSGRSLWAFTTTTVKKTR